jgi:putative acetyltransferase
MHKIITATSEAHYKAGLALFNAYADSLNFNLSFQNFNDELTMLPLMYGAPTGALLLVESENSYVGVAGLRRIENDQTCEIKRMYIDPLHRGNGIGRLLLESLIDVAKNMRYQTIKLDTLAPQMPTALHLYHSFGFTKTEPYNFNPYDGVVYLERKL